MDDERDAEDAIRGLDRSEFGRHGRRLRVEWTKVIPVFAFYGWLLSSYYFYPLKTSSHSVPLHCSKNVVLEGLVVQKDLRI